MSDARDTPKNVDDGKATKVRGRDVSEPFHQSGKRKKHTHTIHGREYTFLYPKPPNDDEQCALMKLPAITCSCCTAEQIRQNLCHARWLKTKLCAKFKLPWGPKLISSTIPNDILLRARETKNWDRAKIIHNYAFTEYDACHVSGRRGCPSVPTLVSGIVMGISRFGNPFDELPPEKARPLFERYVDKNFAPLEPSEVAAILSSFDAS